MPEGVDDDVCALPGALLVGRRHRGQVGGASVQVADEQVQLAGRLVVLNPEETKLDTLTL